jgi:hypothetical protein
MELWRSHPKKSAFGESRRQKARRTQFRSRGLVDVSTAALVLRVYRHGYSRKKQGTCQDLLYAGIWSRQRCVVRVGRTS